MDELTRRSGAAPRDAAATHAPDRRRGGSSVLIVGHDTVILHGVATVLRRMGWSVEVAFRISSARDRLTGCCGDWLILDEDVTDGDGLDLLGWVREQRLPTRVLLVHDCCDPRRQASIAALCPDAVLEKPFDLESLVQALGDGHTR